MKKIYLLSLVWLGICSLSFASDNEVQGKFSVCGNVGYSTYAMQMFNQMTDDMNNNADYTYMDKYNKINGGLNFSVQVQYGILNNLLVGAEIEYLDASQKGKYSFVSDIQYYPTYHEYHALEEDEINIPAVMVGPFVKGAWPLGDNILLTGGLGLDYISVEGKYKSVVTKEAGSPYPGWTSEGTVSGESVAVKLMVGGEIFLTSVISIGLDLGYRYAKVTELKNQNGYILTDQTGKNLELDYSGLLGRGGIRLYF